MKKQTLNEEIGRIKSIMGCCKGKLTEGEENCYSPESTQGKQYLTSLANEIKELGVDAQDVNGSTQNTPEITNAKTKVAEILNPVMPNATREEIKTMIRELKEMRRQKRQSKQQPTPQEQPAQVNEQAGAIAAWESAKVFLLGLPAGVFIAVGAWLILRLLRCHIYEGLVNMRHCGLGAQKSFIIKLAELVFLDFPNLFETDNVFHNCK